MINKLKYSKKYLRKSLILLSCRKKYFIFNYSAIFLILINKRLFYAVSSSYILK